MLSAGSTVANPKFGRCCRSGNVLIPYLGAPPAELRNLLTGDDEHSRHFREHIRQYNNAFAFTSLGVKVDESVVRGPGPYSFKIQGELSHLQGTLLPADDAEPAFAQVYIHDEVEAQQVREWRNPHLRPYILGSLATMLQEFNPFPRLYKHA